MVFYQLHRCNHGLASLLLAANEALILPGIMRFNSFNSSSGAKPLFTSRFTSHHDLNFGCFCKTSLKIKSECWLILQRTWWKYYRALEERVIKLSFFPHWDFHSIFNSVCFPPLKCYNYWRSRANFWRRSWKRPGVTKNFKLYFWLLGSFIYLWV